MSDAARGETAIRTWSWPIDPAAGSDSRGMHMSNALTITDANFENEVVNGGKAIVVDFWAEWCAPCLMIGPVLEELAAEYEGRVRVAKLNVDENPMTSARFGVRSIPTLLFFKSGKVVDQVIGVAQKSLLQKKFEAIL
jgi:thioredoxin 1